MATENRGLVPKNRRVHHPEEKFKKNDHVTDVIT
jgi:hypothetical protein